MAFNGTEGGPITLAEGAEMTANYRKAQPNSTKAHFFGRDALHALLQQEGCMGIRVYYGMDSDSNKQLVLVGADSDENDMTQLVVDGSIPCPIRCGQANALNQSSSSSR